MKLPTQAQSIDRSNRIAAAQMAGVNPASFLDVLKNVGSSLLQKVLS